MCAADRTWTGNANTTWSNNSNWTGGAPGAGDNAVFNTTFTNQPNLTANANPGGIWMTGSIGQNVTISASSGTLMLDGNTIGVTAGLGILVDNTNAFTLTITAPISIESAQTWRNNSGNLLTIGAGGVDLTSNALTIDGSGNTTISGVVAGTAAFTKAGTGTLTLSGANTYTGATTVSAGVLNVRNATGLGTTAGGVTVSSGAALQLQNNITVGAEALTLDGTGISSDGALRNISGNNSWGGTITINSTTRINSDAGTLTLDVASGNAITGSNDNLQIGGAGNVTVNDAIATGTGTLTKNGAGTLTLAAANTIGGTTVSGGALLANNASGSATGTGTVMVNTSGTLLGGNGTITGAVSMASGTNLSPGATIASGATAILKTGALTLSSGSNFTVDLNGTTAGTLYDQLQVTGAVTITGSNIVVRPGSGLNIGDKFFVLLNDGSDGISGMFTQGATVTSGGDTFSINYMDNGDSGILGNDISLTLITIVPEPGTWVSAALALGVLGWSQRRRFISRADKSRG